MTGNCDTTSDATPPVTINLTRRICHNCQTGISTATIYCNASDTTCCNCGTCVFSGSISYTTEPSIDYKKTKEDIAKEKKEAKRVLEMRELWKIDRKNCRRKPNKY